MLTEDNPIWYDSGIGGSHTELLSQFLRLIKREGDL